MDNGIAKRLLQKTGTDDEEELIKVLETATVGRRQKDKEKLIDIDTPAIWRNQMD